MSMKQLPLVLAPIPFITSWNNCLELNLATCPDYTPALAVPSFISSVFNASMNDPRANHSLSFLALVPTFITHPSDTHPNEGEDTLKPTYRLKDTSKVSFGSATLVGFITATDLSEHTKITDPHEITDDMVKAYAKSYGSGHNHKLLKLLNLYVDPYHARMGVATKLVNALYQAAHHTDFIWLITGKTRYGEHGGYNFWKHVGFSYGGEYIKDGDMVLMYKTD